MERRWCRATLRAGSKSRKNQFTAVDISAPTNGAGRLTMIQDTFFESFYAAGSAAQWKKSSFEPVDVTRYDMIETPAILTPRIVVLKVGGLVRAASFCLQQKAHLRFPRSWIGCVWM